MSDHSQNWKIIQVTKMTEELYQACQRLVPQLTSNNPPPTRQELALMLSTESSILYIAKYEGFRDEIIGLVTLVLYRVPTGMRGCIEDVVVDERARGRRIGEALTQACLDRAEQAGASQVMLTSNPARVAANRLYQRMGFELRRTNVYWYGFKQG
jgi:ribosomal protein S18 acetylase RimI-like enzyme